jgi:hypothetical protein
MLEMGILLASKVLNSSDPQEIANFISQEFNCIVTKQDVDLFFAKKSEEDFSVESRKIQYYGSTICND